MSTLCMMPSSLWESRLSVTPKIRSALLRLSGWGPLVCGTPAKSGGSAPLRTLQRKPLDAKPPPSKTVMFLKDCVWEERFATMNRMIAGPAGLSSLYARQDCCVCLV